MYMCAHNLLPPGNTLLPPWDDYVYFICQSENSSFSCLIFFLALKENLMSQGIEKQVVII